MDNKELLENELNEVAGGDIGIEVTPINVGNNIDISIKGRPGNNYVIKDNDELNPISNNNGLINSECNGNIEFNKCEFNGSVLNREDK